MPRREKEEQRDVKEPNIQDKVRNYSLGVPKPKVKVSVPSNKNQDNYSTPEKEIKDDYMILEERRLMYQGEVRRIKQTLDFS